MKLTRSESFYTIEKDDGSSLILSHEEIRSLYFQIKDDYLREDILYNVESYDGDVIALGSYDGTVDEFVDEVHCKLEDAISRGDYISEDDVQDAILDLAESYGIRIDE